MLPDWFYYVGIPAGIVVILLLIILLVWYCRRRAQQSAIDNALRSSQSYVNSTQGISHTLHSDGTVTRNTITNQSLSSQDNAKFDGKKKLAVAGAETPQSSGIGAPAAKLELIGPATETETPNHSINDDSDTENINNNENNDTKTNHNNSMDGTNGSDNYKHNRNSDNNIEPINQGIETASTKKDTTQDKLINLTNMNKQNSKSNNNNNNNNNNSNKSKGKIVKLKKGGASQVLESENENLSDGSIDENEEINKIMNEELDGDTIKRLTLHKKLSNINVRSKAGDSLIDIDDDEDDEDENDSLNDDMIEDIPPKTDANGRNSARNSGTGVIGIQNTLTSPNNEMNNNVNNETNDASNKHRRMVSQEEIDYFEKMKDETIDDTRDYRSRTISTTANANRQTNINASLIDKK